MTPSTVLPAADRIPTQLVDGETTYRLVRAWPRSVDHMLLELARHDGQEVPGTVVGQWFADTDALAAEAEAAPPPAHRLGPVLLQPDGVDPRLPGLADVLDEPGASLIGHRPGRRAVVRVSRPEGEVFVKVVRKPRRAEDVVRRGRLVQTLVGPRTVVPELHEADIPRGVVGWSDVGGDTFSELGTSWAPGQAHSAWERAGRDIADLHAADVDLVEDRHDDEAEIAGADRWLRPAVAHGRLHPETVGRARARVVAALKELAGPPAIGVLHRDLHDRQLLLRPDGRIGLIDVDTLAVGERAVDHANVLVHLELRQAQGLLTPETAAAAWQGFRDGMSAGAAAHGQPGVIERSWSRLPAYLLACRLRMAAIYSFRPQWHDLAQALLTSVAEGAGTATQPLSFVRDGRPQMPMSS